MDDIISFLRKVAVFSNLTEEELRLLAPYMERLELAQDVRLIKQGDAGNELYIVGEGCVKASVTTTDGGSVTVAEFHAGDFFGEMSIFEDAPRSAHCDVCAGSVLFRLAKEAFFAFIMKQPETAIRVMYRMLNVTTHRLHDTSRFLSDLVKFGEGARRRAITDALTGLYNRRHLDDAMEEQFNKARLNGTILTIVMVDLDHFGSVNARFGQAAGDFVIKTVAPVFKRHFLERHILARYGGDEFTFVLPETDPSTAFDIAERVRIEVRDMDIVVGPAGETARVSTSQGIAAYPRHAATLLELKEKADKALYSAKEGGRDRVTILD